MVELPQYPIEYVHLICVTPDDRIIMKKQEYETLWTVTLNRKFNPDSYDKNRLINSVYSQIFCVFALPRVKMEQAPIHVVSHRPVAAVLPRLVHVYLVYLPSKVVMKISTKVSLRIVSDQQLFRLLKTNRDDFTMDTLEVMEAALDIKDYYHYR